MSSRQGLILKDDIQSTAMRTDSRNTLNNVVRNRTRLSKVLVIESLIGIKGNLRVIGNAVSEIVRMQIHPQVCIIVVSTAGN
jgi:hypothetical protein